MTFVSILVSIPAKSEEMVGHFRPAPECDSYFELKSGTPIDTDVRYWPFRGHAGTASGFIATDQTKYTMISGDRQIFRLRLRRLKRALQRFERRSEGGIIWFIVQASRHLYPLHRIPETRLETRNICDSRQFAFEDFGVFTLCPDWQLLTAPTACLTSMQIASERSHAAGDAALDDDLSRQFPPDVQRDSVGVFDAFDKANRARSPTRIRASAKSTHSQDFAMLDVGLGDAGLSRLRDHRSIGEIDSANWAFQTWLLYDHSADISDDPNIRQAPRAASMSNKNFVLPKPPIFAA